MSAMNYPPLSMQSCANCRYYRYPEGGFSTCRRHSPICPSLDLNLVTSWPLVNPEDWCGEWAPDEEVL
jgi:hypothetical protein